MPQPRSWDRLHLCEWPPLHTTDQERAIIAQWEHDNADYLAMIAEALEYADELDDLDG